MTFSATLVQHNKVGSFYEQYYEFSGADDDEGGTIQTTFRRIYLVKACGNLATGLANMSQITCGRTANAGEIAIVYADQDADHEGLIKVVGRY